MVFAAPLRSRTNEFQIYEVRNPQFRPGVARLRDVHTHCQAEAGTAGGQFPNLPRFQGLPTYGAKR